MARVVVDVMPKPEILDPQGKAVHAALPRLGHKPRRCGCGRILHSGTAHRERRRRNAQPRTAGRCSGRLGRARSTAGVPLRCPATASTKGKVLTVQVIICESPEQVGSRAADIIDAQRARGLELGLERSISDRWQVSAGYALQDAEITETTIM